MKPQIRKIGKDRMDELESFLKPSTEDVFGFDGSGNPPFVLMDPRILNKMIKHIESTEIMLRRLQSSPTRLWLSHSETCEFLGVSDTTLRDYRDRGLLAFSQRDRQIWFNFEDIEEFLRHHKHEAFQYRS